jgi:thiamine-phosphate pyrophosphorylase
MVPSPSRPDRQFPRLYAILDVDQLQARGLAPATVLEAWLDAGVRLIQLRAKSLAFGRMLELAQQSGDACRRASATFIVNDRADVARLARSSGVHLGQEDLGVSEARRVLSDGQLVGVSAHHAGQAGSALAQGADYVAIGPVYQTSTKERPDPTVGLEGVLAVSALTRAVSTPLVAIGGITLESAPGVLASGADAVAVISDLMAGDWRRRVVEFVRALR